MTASETRRVHVTLAVLLDDLFTGRPLAPDPSLRLTSGDGFLHPVAKNDGYFIFTGSRPDSLRLCSRRYESLLLPLEDKEAGLLRLAPVPLPGNGGANALSLTLREGECAHVGFWGDKSGYAAASEPRAGMKELHLFKDDYQDLTHLYHAMLQPDGTAEAVFFGEALGGGRYNLPKALTRDGFRHLTRFVPLYRIGGHGKPLAIPLPKGTKSVFLLRDGILEQQTVKGG